MEARRRDFETFWSDKALPAMRDLKVPMLFWLAVKHVAWLAFSRRP